MNYKMDEPNGDDIYERLQNCGDLPPWESPENKESAIDCLTKILPDTFQGKDIKILDYGCGNGHIGDYFLQKGANVDFADIAHTKVEALRIKYSIPKDLGNVLDGKNGGNARVFEAKTPNDLPVENGSYDYIIIWNVFHHINPNHWKGFLDKFGNLLKKGGKIILQGVDETSILFKKY